MAHGCFALTGGIASGKSFVLQEFRKQGFRTLDCDSIVGKLYREEKVKKKLRKAFGTASRKEIAELVFSVPSKRKKLEALLHPLVFKELKKKLSFLKKGKKPVVADAPLLFESRQPFQKLFLAVIVVKSTKEQQLGRLLKRGPSRKEALLRIKAQMPLEKKLKKAHFIIDNTKGKRFSKKEVKNIAIKLRELT